MSSDLTAMRWQLIRTIEADQLLEQENIELRQKLKSCEEQLGQVTVAHREACAKIAIGMERTVSQLRSDIGDTRSQYFVEMDLMKQGFKEVAGQLGQMSRKNKELRQQSEALAVANARLQNDLEKSCSHSDKKTGHLSDELSRVKKELIDACAQHTHALSIIDAKDQAIRNKEADIDELNKQLKSSQQNIGRLNRTIKQLELHGSSEIEDIKKKSLDAEAMYNEKINSMEIEIGQLKSDIVGYKDEISRLSVKQAPKKTPFTQYVDLKNQNENLKAKVVDLKNIVRSVDPKQKSKVGHLVGMTAVDSVDNMIANCANVAKSQPTSPRMNNIRTASSNVPDVVNNTHHLDGMSDNLMELSVPSLNPHPPARAITGTSILSTKTIIKIPSSQKGNTQRPSQYRTGARPKVVLNEKVMRSSTSENPARPQSGRSKTSRAPSPIVM